MFLQQAFPEWLVCPLDLSMKKRKQCWKETLTLTHIKVQSLWAGADPHRFSRTSSVHLSQLHFQQPPWGCPEKESAKAKIMASPTLRDQHTTTKKAQPRAPPFLSTQRQPLSPFSPVPTILTYRSLRPTLCVTARCPCMCLTARAQESAACLRIASPSLHGCVNFVSLCLLQSQQQCKDFFRHTKAEVGLLMETISPKAWGGAMLVGFLGEGSLRLSSCF